LNSNLKTTVSYITILLFLFNLDDMLTPPSSSAPIFNYILGFLLIGIAWGFTTPFIRAAARTHSPPPHPILDTPAVKASWVKTKLYGIFFGVVDLLRNPRYAIPLVINLTGSVWFFLLIGKAGKFAISFMLLQECFEPACRDLEKVMKRD
jgi:thiamine transporter ThiT